MTHKLTLTRGRVQSILKGIGSIVELDLDFVGSKPGSLFRNSDVSKPRFSTRTIQRSLSPVKISTYAKRLKISDIITVDKTTLEGKKVLLEGSAKAGSVIVRQRMAEPDEHILIRGTLSPTGRLTDVVLVSESQGTSALLSGKKVRIAQSL